MRGPDEGAYQAHDESFGEVGDVGVDQADHVSGRRGNTLEDRLSLSLGSAEFREYLVVEDDLCSCVLGYFPRAVHRAGVDHHDLVYQARVAQAGEGLYHGTDGLFFVQGGHASRHGGRTLAGDHLCEVELAEREAFDSCLLCRKGHGATGRSYRSGTSRVALSSCL